MKIKTLVFGVALLSTLSSMSFATERIVHFDSSELTYNIEKVYTGDVLNKKFKLTNIRYRGLGVADGLQVEENEMHDTSDFICKNELNGHSYIHESELDYAPKGKTLAAIDLLSDRPSIVLPEVYKSPRDEDAMAIKSVMCIVRTYKSLDNLR